ncbi:hypothetical protein ACFVIY_41100 [Streptomyces sp. NPDC127166]|uniref:hypothetical protein n=1 Tax=Streptomyces sp. NPDC127166 TaxID=3345380 RepID=UPI00362DDD97
MSDAEREVLGAAIVRLPLDHRADARVKGKLKWEDRDDHVRIVYVPTAVGTIILVAYVEVD